MKEKETRGGAQKGSGRKPKSIEGRRVQMTVTVLPSHYEALKNLDTSETLDMGLKYSIEILTAARHK